MINENYLKTFWKFYLLRKPKLILTVLLTLFIYFWLIKIIDKSSTIFTDGHLTNTDSINTALNIIYFKCVKPILIYIGGIIIINKI
jgi:hypothetical protein